MMMNSLVAFEVVLTASCMISLYLARQAFFPVSLFWAFGSATFGIAAALGAFKFAGFVEVESYHTTAKYFAGSVGLICFALGAIGGLFANLFIRFWWWIILGLVIALTIALLLGQWRITPDVQKIVVGVVFLVGLVRLISSGVLALYLIIGSACLVLSGVAVKWIALNTGLDATNIYHILLSFAVVSFGVSASRDEGE
ncbi:hypothetical protein NBZ79_17650 [Sneathiella marina]|uniref:DUF4203 domain-containing protein n=1 Tax=Sneathiella marina TaxID=2950108 RepID=A0ABY4W5J2_9PROT|nr:hypothetical protein [Sneathiella marina]USG60985.1 hypothetical protein NBZ79_17650 [Sneathiella marina]